MRELYELFDSSAPEERLLKTEAAREFDDFEAALGLRDSECIG